MNLQPYLDFAVSLAHRAGMMTLAHFNVGVTVDFKEGDDPVTVADREAEKFIRAEIERAYPRHSIVGEEFGVSGGESAFRWAIDPIDGTRSFTRGVPLYGVLIGLEIEGTFRVGAAYFPPLDEMLCAAEGLGCWLNSRRARVSSVSELSRACLVTTDFERLRRQAAELTERFAKRGTLLRTWGDAYGYALVATGRAEICLDSFLHVWDYAPFPVILREAGGFFGNWRGADDLQAGDALACNAALKEDALEVLRGCQPN